MNNIYINNNDIDGLHFGSSSVSKVYFGSNLVYEEAPSILNYLQFTARNGDASIGMLTAGTAPNVSYSFDMVNWTTWDYTNVVIPQDETIYFKGNNPSGFSSTNVVDYNYFTMSGTIEANGSVQSLIYEDNFENNLTIPTNYCFNGLFEYCASLTTAPELPATALTEGCYNGMFARCSGITSPPTLPATTLAASCYTNMFARCSGLTTPPELPATTLAASCYYQMFYYCTSLTTPPELPATTLVNNCYQYMFARCSSLTESPELSALTLADECYLQMFAYCSSLTKITMLATDISATDCLYNWVRNVSASGTFVKNSAAQWDVSGYSGIPTGWTVQTITP